MYQNPATFNSVTLPAYTNPNALYNPALSTMDGAGAVVPITQNLNPREASLVHRINPPAGLYPYALPHATTMQPRDALLAAANLLARSESDLSLPPYMRSPGSGHEEFARNGGNLQQFIAQQQAATFHAPPVTSVLLVQQQSTVVPSYLARQSEHMQAINPSAAPVPFVTVPLTGATNIPIGRQVFSNSPPQEQTQPNPPHLENIQYLQQPLIQQTSNRSTPLADFADIAVLHDQGQLFSNNTVMSSSSHSGQNPNQQQEETIQQMQQREQMQMHDDVGLLASVTKDLLWAPESQQQSKMEREDQVSLVKEEMFSVPQMQKSSDINPQNPTDPFIFPVSIPVHCSRDEATPVTTTLHSYYRQQHGDAFTNNMSAFHDDPMVQESINVANPSTILPNSMMGGNPSGFRSFRQRHHSEGSVLKKTWQSDMHPKDNMKSLKQDHQMPDYSSGNFKQHHEPGVVLGDNRSPDIIGVPTGCKRKVDTLSQVGISKKVKTEVPHELTREVQIEAQAVTEAKKEVWTVPKEAPPNRQRHRRHSAESRLQYRSGQLFSRSAYLSSIQMMGKPVPGRPMGTGDTREKRRPPPLIIPPSVNAYTNGPLFISHLHHRRRPSGDSVSSCGNEKIPPYTPPPMLSPLRFGTGLFHNTPGTPSLKPVYRQASGEPITTITPIPEEEDELVRSADPKINIGAEYQADIPDLCPRRQITRDVHNADLVWKPKPRMLKENSTESRHVEEYLKLACSAAVPHGGSNKEFALHLLHKNKGDILTSVRQLLCNKVTVAFDHWMASYTYMGSVEWSLKERQSFERGMMQFHKDFYQVAKLVGSKTTAQCVDYYYHTVKRRRRRIQRPRRFRRDSEEEEIQVAFSPSPNESESHPSDENDFLQDHVLSRLESSVTFKEENHDHRTPEVVRRSPPVTTFIRAPPQVNRVIGGIKQPSTILEYAQHIPQIHSYARQPLTLPPQSTQGLQVQGVRNFPQTVAAQPLSCKVPNCNQSFPNMQLFLQHQQTTHKNLKPFLEHLNQASPSPSSSPASVASTDADTPQFRCPRCGKTFSKVKSRNAHMKTHGKLAQEKRRQKEEEARRKMEEAAAWRSRQQQQQQQQRMIHPSLTKPPGM